MQGHSLHQLRTPRVQAKPEEAAAGIIWGLDMTNPNQRRAEETEGQERGDPHPTQDGLALESGERTSSPRETRCWRQGREQQKGKLGKLATQGQATATQPKATAASMGNSKTASAESQRGGARGGARGAPANTAGNQGLGEKKICTESKQQGQADVWGYRPLQTEGRKGHAGKPPARKGCLPRLHAPARTQQTHSGQNPAGATRT